MDPKLDRFMSFIYTAQNKLRVNKLNGSNIMRNTNDTIIAYSNKCLHDLCTETQVTISKNAFHSFSNVLLPYFLLISLVKLTPHLRNKVVMSFDLLTCFD